MRRKRETHLLKLGDTTGSSPEAMGMLKMRRATHGDGVHAKMAGDTYRHVGIRQNYSEQPASPTRSPRQHTDLLNELEGHVNTPNMHRYAHSDVDGSNAPEKVSVTPNLPARGALSRMNEPEGPGDSMDAPDAYTYT